METPETLRITPSAHDMHLLQLGKLYFNMKAHPTDGMYLIYTKEEHMKVPSMGDALEGFSQAPYCYTLVRLNEFERMLGIPLRRKIEKKIAKFKKFLIHEDIQIGITKTTGRKLDL